MIITNSTCPSGDLGVNGGWEVGDLGVSILSLTGQPILQTTLSAGEVSKTISVAQLPVGLYLYIVNGSTDNGGSVVARGKVAVLG